VNKKMIAIAVAAAVVLTGIWYVALLSPQSKSLHKAKDQTASANGQAATLRSEIAVLQKEKVQLPATAAKLTALKLALPDTPALDKLVDDINAAATQTGIDWQTITPTKPATFAAGSGQAVSTGPAAGLQSVTVAMQVNGASNQITDFVTKLTGMSRLLDVTSFNLTNPTAAPKSTGQITTQIFFVPPPAGSSQVTTTTTVKP
jgi:Tfp pilus assembly protein PilO